MTDESGQILDDLLIRWHHACKHYRHTRGFNSRAPGTDGYRPSRQYDDTNGALDHHLEASQVEAVDFEVSQLQEPYRSAIHANARNLSSGSTVWSSPRIPSDPAERTALIWAARYMLINRLQSAGVM